MPKSTPERRIDLPSAAGRSSPYTSGSTSGATGLANHAHDGTANSGGVLSGYAAAVHDHDWSDISGYLASLDYLDNLTMGGRLWGGVITDNGDGTVAIAAGGGLIKADDAGPQDVPSSVSQGQGSNIAYVTWDAVASLSLVDEAYNYIYYDGADGTIKTTVDFYAISFTQDFTLGRGYRSGTSVIVRLCGTNAWNFNRRVQLFGEEYIPVVRARGMALTGTGTRNIAITAGILWAELVNRFTTDAFDSSGVDRFSYWYRNGAGGWTRVNSQAQISNTQYDDGDGTLANLTANRYGVHWVYVAHDSSVHVVYGQGNYTLAQAEAATAPGSLPGLVAAYATLIGRIIIQQGATSFTQIDSAFTTTFSTSGITNHADLAGLTLAGSHPATAISTDTSTWLGELSGASANVQSALDVLDDHKHSAADITSGTLAAERGGTGVSNTGSLTVGVDLELDGTADSVLTLDADLTVEDDTVLTGGGTLDLGGQIVDVLRSGTVAVVEATDNNLRIPNLLLMRPREIAAYLTASDAGDSDQFGVAVALSADGSVLVVGATNWDGGAGSDQGAVYIYDWNGSAWVERTTALTASDTGAGDNFGASVALSADGSILAVGARSWDGVVNDCGAVYTFATCASGWPKRSSVTGGVEVIESGTAKSTPGTVDRWIRLTLAGVTCYIPAYISKTS